MTSQHSSMCGNFNLSGNILFNEMEESINQSTRTSNRLQTIEELDLSQRINNLTTAVKNKINKSSTLLKKIVTDMDQSPNYLIKSNHLWIKFFSDIKDSTRIVGTKKEFEKIRRLAVTIYKLTLLELYERLWNIYLKSGTGKLCEDSIELFKHTKNFSIWPTIIKQCLNLQTSTSNHHDIYLNMIQEDLLILKEHSQQLKAHMRNMTVDLKDNASKIEQMVRNYIENNICLKRLQIEHEMNIIQFDYFIRTLEFEFNQHKPNAIQKRFMKDLCRHTFNFETYEHEYSFIQHYLTKSQYFDRCFDDSSIFDSTSLSGIEQSKFLQIQLVDKLKKTAIESKLKLAQLHLETVDNRRHEYRKVYETQRTGMKNMFSSTNEMNTNSSILMNLIEERCKKIGDRIKCIYQYRINLSNIEYHE